MSAQQPDEENRLPGSQEALDEARLVTVTERSTETEAAIIVSILRDAGIRAVAVGGFTAGFRAEAPGWVRVKTLEMDAERARRVIAEIRRADAPDESDDGPPTDS